jgi:hypothetical protein
MTQGLRKVQSSTLKELGELNAKLHIAGTWRAQCCRNVKKRMK